jgi:ferrochelatase
MVFMKALLLLAFGGPRSLDEVELLLTRLFGRKPSPEQLEGVKERYRLIGGSSPLPAITEKQARAIEEKLNDKGYSFKSYVGMRYCKPLVEETLKEILQDDVEEVIAIPMAPFRSRFSTEAYREELSRANKDSGNRFRVTFIEGWHSHPLFLDAIVEKVREGLSHFTPDEREGVHLIFSAHSLPESIIKSDPYVDDFRESAEKVLQRVGSYHWHMAFQSKGRGPEKWIGPDVETVLIELQKINVRKVLIVPVGFVSDHIEILYDIDILYRKKAETLGMTLKRTQSLNYSGRFIEALATIVEERIKGFKESRIQEV